MISRLEPDIPVAVLNFQDPTHFKECLEKLGVLLEKENAAEEYLDWYDGVINGIAEKTGQLEEEEMTTYFQRSLWAENITTFTDAKAGIPFRNKLTGSVNVAADSLPGRMGSICRSGMACHSGYRCHLNVASNLSRPRVLPRYRVEKSF